MSDNLLFQEGGPGLWHTDKLASRSPVVLHGVGMDIAGTAPLDKVYLHALRSLIDRYQPLLVSDHLSFGRSLEHFSYELLPVSRTPSALARIVDRITCVQDILGCQLSVENISAYVEYQEPQMGEGDFFCELVDRSKCGLLLDVNNLYVNAFNFGRDAHQEIYCYPLSAVTQLHVAGHTDCGSYLFDTHDQAVHDDVCSLMVKALQLIAKPSLPVVLERDGNGASLNDVLVELASLKGAYTGAFSGIDSETHR